MSSRICKFFIYGTISFSYSVSVYSLERISTNHLSNKDRSLLQSWISHQSLNKHNNIYSLRNISHHKDERQITHRRLQQEYYGFPVRGGYIISHVDETKNAIATGSLSGSFYRGFENEIGQPDVNFISNATTFLSDFTAQLNATKILEKTSEPIIYVDENNQAHFAYKISALIETNDAKIEKPAVIIDANNSTVYRKWNDLKTLKNQVSATGYGGNYRVGEYLFGNKLPYLSITRDNFSEICYMENKRVRVVDMNFNYDNFTQPMKFECQNQAVDNLGAYWTGYGNDGYDQVNGAYSPSNDAFYIAEIIQKMYHDWYNVSALTINNKPMQLIMRVHYGREYENAFWNGKVMTFGDGKSRFYPLVSLDIGAHEVSHGFTEQNSNLEYYDQSGGMNESFSDMAAQVATYFVNGENNWMIGSEVIKEKSGYIALRYMNEPSRDGRSIENIKQYKRGMDVHYLSGVYNKLFYLLSMTNGWNPRSAFHVMLKANMDYWTPTSTFDEGSCGILKSAIDLNMNVDDVQKAMQIVGLHCMEDVSTTQLT